MTDSRVPTGKSRRLSEVVREVKIAAAERQDVVVDMKEADRARLELLAEELMPIFDEVPDENEQFDFVISSGLQPRLWIDAVAHAPRHWICRGAQSALSLAAFARSVSSLDRTSSLGSASLARSTVSVISAVHSPRAQVSSASTAASRLSIAGLCSAAQITGQPLPGNLTRSLTMNCTERCGS